MATFIYGKERFFYGFKAMIKLATIGARQGMDKDRPRAHYRSLAKIYIPESVVYLLSDSYEVTLHRVA